LRRIWIPALLTGLLGLDGATAASAASAAVRPPTERLPIRVYTAADGLAGDEIHTLLPDSRGFLWIGTRSGLSRFDGSRFVSYDPRQGLPSPNVTALLESPAGGLLVGTTGGLARLDLAPAGTGRIFRPAADGPAGRGRVTALLKDGGSPWLAEPAPGGGLFRLRPGAPLPEKTGMPESPDILGITALAPDGAGGLWVGRRTGLLHRLASGRFLAAPILPSPRLEGVGALLLDSRHRLWVLTASSLYVLAPGTAAGTGATEAGGSLFERSRAGICQPGGSLRLPAAPGAVCRFDFATAGPRLDGAMIETRAGKIWLATPTGLHALDAGDGTKGVGLHSYTRRDGLLDDELVGLAEDRDGDLWVGTRSHGLMRIAPSGFLTFGTGGMGNPGGASAEAPPGIAVGEIFEDRRGSLYVWGSQGQHPQLFHFDGQALADVRPRARARAAPPRRGRRPVVVADPDGGLWLGDGAGIWRFSPGAPGTYFKAPAGIGEISRLFRDSRGRFWVSSLGEEAPGLSANGANGANGRITRWDPGTGRFSPVPALDRLARGAGASGASGTAGGSASAFAEDSFGQLWIGLSGGGLARLRGDTADLFLTGDGTPPLGAVNDLRVDRHRRLWVATSYGGVLRFEDLDAPRPRSIAYTSSPGAPGFPGLSSDRILCVTEDREGAIYLGHGRGIDRLDPDTGRIRALTVADGLPASVVNVAYGARDGSLWFGTASGPARYLPAAPKSASPPPVFLTSLRLGGVPVALPPLGLHDLTGLTLPAERNQVEAHFSGISFAYGAALRYQYQLQGGLPGSAAAWSEPQTEHAVLLGGLAPGDYRLLVRAVTPEGVASPSPALLAFTLLRPYWQRWWFRLLVAFAVALLAWTLYRARRQRLQELERVRTGIAADLHDDLSSSLSRISILAELSRRRVADPAAPEATFLDQIGETARELMEATGDIVWALDARRDDLASLLARIRRFASDLFESRGIAVHFSAPPRAAEIALRPAARRELYLVLKEALHNASRHAQAGAVWIEVAAPGGELLAEVRDDGIGFSPDPAGDGGPAGASAGGKDGAGGHGLRNLRQRAARLGGELTIDSAPGEGTRVRLRLKP
jgi:signal transduction histidine kinase/ligand-binding sensor domain-containing protein